MINYDNVQYARERLLETIIRAKGKAAKLLNINERRATVIYLTTTDFDDDVMLKDLDITPVPLGYVNSNRVASYLTRVPHRKWKQGFIPRNNGRTICGYAAGDLPEEAIGKTIDGKFPSFLKCIADLRPASTVAFNRNFCMFHNAIDDIQLWYKGQFHVGQIHNKTFTLKDDFQWVEESLEEAIENAN